MVRGEWVDRPAGDAIFGPYFNKSLHLRGDAKSGILPSTKYPIICGWDPGSVNNAVIFMQALPGVDKTIWAVFDEFVVINKKLPYTTLIPMVMRKMAYWNRRMDHKFKFIHISDNSAFNQYRAKTGSYDVKDIEEISRTKSGTFKLDPIKMKAAPKFSGSVEARVRLVIAKLSNEEFMMSVPCVNCAKMFRNLVSEKPGKNYEPNIAFKPKRSIYIHSFDALSYPIIYYESTQYVDVGRTSGSQIVELGT